MKLFPVMLGLAGCALVASIFIPAVPFCGPSKETTLTQIEISRLQIALHYYEHEYRRLPDETSNARLVAILGGDNPRKLTIYLPEERRIKAGEVVDAWGGPFIFKSTANGLLILSAGKDGIYYTQDDISAETHRSPAARPTT